MLIRSVTAHAFGPLVGETLTFADGMTVVHGANESAKSSWHAAIYAALCGRRRGRVPSADERRFAELHRPWDRDDWVVSAEVLLDDGRRLEVRQDLAGRVDCDVRDLDLGRDCSDEFIKDGTPDLARWLGLDRHSFLATACVAQAQVMAIHDKAGGLQEQLQRAAATAGADQTAASALARIETYRREQVGSDRAPRRPLRIATAAVTEAEIVLADARAAHAAYQQRLVDGDQFRAVAAEAERALRRYEGAVAARTAAQQSEELTRQAADARRQADDMVGQADGFQTRLAEVDRLATEVGSTEPASSVDDEATASRITAALSAWDSRPSLPDDPLPGDTALDPVDLDAECVDAFGLDAFDVGVVGVDGAYVADTEPVRADVTGVSLGGVESTGADLGIAGLGGAGLDGSGLSGAGLARAGLGAAGLGGGGLDDNGPGGASIRGAEVGGAGLDGADARRREAEDTDGGQALSTVDGAGFGGAEHGGTDDVGRGVGGADASAGEVEDIDSAVPLSTIDGVVGREAGGTVAARPQSLVDGADGDADPAAGLTDRELWDLARDLELVTPPADPAIGERVAAARTRHAIAAGKRRRGRRLRVGAMVLGFVALAVVAVAVAGESTLGTGAAPLVAAILTAVVLAVVALVCGMLSVKVSRGDDPVAIQREVDAALLEVAAEMRAHETASAQRANARSRVVRLGLPDSADTIRELARIRAGSTMVADRDARWEKELSEASEQWRSDLLETRRVAQEQVTEARLRVQQELSEAKRLAEREIIETRLRAQRQITETRDLAQRRISRDRQEVRQQVLEARAQAREQILDVRQRAATLVTTAATECGISVSDPDDPQDTVKALLRWQQDRALRIAELDEARRGWNRLQGLVGLGSAGGTAEVAQAVEELRRAAEQARDRATQAMARAEDLAVRAAIQAAGVEPGDWPAVPEDGDSVTLQRLSEELVTANASADKAEGARRALERGLPSVSEAEEQLNRTGVELTRLRELDRTLELTRSFLATAQERAHRTIAPVLVETVGTWLPGATSGRYTGVIVDPEKLRVQVRGPGGRWRDAELLSHGTAEQIYLLLRIALAQHLARPTTVCPLLFDDVTVHADTQRTEQILELLLAAAQHRQIILFTQQDQVREWAASRLTGQPATGPGHTIHTLPALTTV